MSAWDVYKHMRETGDFERVLQAIENLSQRPPVVVAVPAQSTQVNPREMTIDDPPKSIDGQHYRHKLVGGGYLIEVLSTDPSEMQRRLYYEPPGGDRFELTDKPRKGCMIEEDRPGNRGVPSPEAAS